MKLSLDSCHSDTVLASCPSVRFSPGVFNAELNEFLARTLGEDGYAGVEVRVTPIRTEIIIRATRTHRRDEQLLV